jgi:predicted DsbA family dithiol-disulfide isomerase
MTEPIHIAMYADLHCPYAYLSAYRLRKLRDEYRGRIIIEHKSLSLEYVNREPTPKHILDNETPILMLEEPAIPYQPWHRSLSEWPVTMWPAFEAVKCAERQSLELADELDWAIRTAFFGESRCISMRYVLFGLAEKVGVEMGRFADDFDHGVAKYQVLQEAQEGWERLKVEGSPTFVLPSGKQYSNVGLPQITLDEKRHFRPVAVQPAPCKGEKCLDLYRQLFAEALQHAHSSSIS